MKKSLFTSAMLIVFCFFSGIKTSTAQTCSVSINYTAGANGLIVFSGNAVPSTSLTFYYWYLPGSNNVTVQGTGNAFLNPSATYSANGIYTVTFGMSSSVPMCSVGITQTISVNNVTTTPPPCTLNVVYSLPSPALCNGSATVIPNGMCGPITYTWIPGNLVGGSISGLCQGTTYSVIAAAPSGVNCCSVAVGAVTIPTINPCPTTANFNFSQGASGLVFFSNTTSGPLTGATYSWNFGNGGSSNIASPSHTYSSNGTYSVTLTVQTSSICISTKTMVINVNSFCTLVAGFTYSNLTSNNKQFNNTTTANYGPVGYTWNFGDGSPTSSAMNPSRTYTALGTYTVVLTANNFSLSSGACISTATTAITISTICSANASFSVAPTGTAQYWNAYPLVPTNISAATWYWGDGTTSNVLYTSHTYSAAGMYSICLTITVSCGSTASYCFGYSIYRQSQDMGMVYLNVLDPSLTTGIQNVFDENENYRIYPNPNSGLFNLSGFPEGSYNIVVFNMMGKQIYHSEKTIVDGKSAKEIELDAAANGVYFVKIQGENGVTIKKIMIESNR